MLTGSVYSRHKVSQSRSLPSALSYSEAEKRLKLLGILAPEKIINASRSFILCSNKICPIALTTVRAASTLLIRLKRNAPEVKDLIFHCTHGLNFRDSKESD